MSGVRLLIFIYGTILLKECKPLATVPEIPLPPCQPKVEVHHRILADTIQNHNAANAVSEMLMLNFMVQLLT